MNKINCNKCNKEFNAAPKTYRKNKISFQFLECPKCHAIYPISAIDEELKINIAKVNEITNKILSIKNKKISYNQKIELVKLNEERNRLIQENVQTSDKLIKDNISVFKKLGDVYIEE